MQQLKFWRNRLRKFRDNPRAVWPFVRKYCYYNFIGDSYIKYYRDVHFLSYEETAEAILTEGKSIVRFGDEVFDMLLGIGLYFNDWRQKYEPSLAARTKEVLASREPKLLVCFNPELILMNKEEFKAKGIAEQHHFWTHSRIFLKGYLSPTQAYGRALTFHERYNPALPYDRLIEHLRRKHLIIVASNTARFGGRQFGLTTTYIEAPKSDAWSQYDSLLSSVLTEAGKYARGSVLVLASIGPAAKVMVYDLVRQGYTAWDTGQFFDLALKRLT